MQAARSTASVRSTFRIAARALRASLRHGGRAAGGLVLAAALASAANAASDCTYMDIDVSLYGEKPFHNPPEIVARDHVVKTRLAVQYTDPSQVSIAGCGVKLRTYNGQLVVGPTLRVKPGEVLDILLDNRLPAETPAETAAQFEQERSNAHLSVVPASFNTTNLHTHGLHVSPAGNSDNVLLSILPQTKFPYEIKVPASHPPGTFWYHAHAHGSTSIQVGSGMAGALILDDDPAKFPLFLRDANKGEEDPGHPDHPLQYRWRAEPDFGAVSRPEGVPAAVTAQSRHLDLQPTASDDQRPDPSGHHHAPRRGPALAADRHVVP